MDALAQIEQIKQLKYRYFRTLDTNDWSSFADCLTEDCTANYGDGEYSFDGRDAIVGFMSKNMSAETFLSMHNGHHPEISVADDGQTATGTWYLQDTILDLANNIRLYGTGIYTDRYVKSDGEWKIAETGYARVFECMEPLGEHHKVLKNRFVK